jgi:hypothetical protein
VTSIASLADSIGKGLCCLADEMSLAGVEVRVYANEIDAFAKLLLQMQTSPGLTTLRYAWNRHRKSPGPLVFLAHVEGNGVAMASSRLVGLGTVLLYL